MLIPSTASVNHPRAILGLMTFGPPGTEEKGSRITDINEFNKCLDFLQSKGYDEIDTARVYISGQQEAFTAEAQWKARGFTLATKCYPTEAGKHKPEALKATFDKSLRELGTDCVDIFYLHAPDRSVPFEETLQACNDLFKEGKFVTLGLSNYAAWEVAEIVNIARERGWVQPRIYQAMYNALTRKIEEELIPCCRKYALDIVVYNPLAGGIFSGKYNATTPQDMPSDGRFSDTNAGAGKMYRERYFKTATFDALKLIEPVVKKNNLTMVETALRWLEHHSKLKMRPEGNDGVILGVSSLKQLETNISNLEEGPLPEEVVKVLDEAWDITRGTATTYWR